MNFYIFETLFFLSFQLVSWQLCAKNCLERPEKFSNTTLSSIILHITDILLYKLLLVYLIRDVVTLFKNVCKVRLSKILFHLIFLYVYVHMYVC